MAQTYSTTEGTLIIPGGYSSFTVQQNPSGLATTGVLMLVGEADTGPRFDDEADLEDNAFGPDQYADVVAKYTSGPLVDAFREAIAASGDAAIPGSFSRAILVKTNESVRASGYLSKVGGGNWGVLESYSEGANGNLLSYAVTSQQAEVLPTTGAFTYIPPIENTDIEFRVNGGAAVAYTINAGTMPAALVAAVDALAGPRSTGGANRGILGGVAGNLEVTVISGNLVTITYSGTWAVTPSVGDLMYIPSGSAIQGAGNQNRGSYVVMAATTTQITATKVLDIAGATPNQCTAPAAVGSTPVAAVTDVQAHAPVVFTIETGVVVNGKGKTLEVAEMATATGRLSYNAYALSTTPCAWVSTAASPKVITATEFIPKLTVTRSLDGVNEEVYEGGKVLLALGYDGTTAQAVIANGVMTITVAGGTGTSPAPITLSNYPTVGDLVTYLNSLTGFTAAVGAGYLTSQDPTTLDEGTFTCCTTHGAKTGRIKQDAYRFYSAVNRSAFVRMSTQPTSGVPTTSVTSFLAGGSRGGSADSDFTAAFTALESVRGNFVVPLASNNATVDIADGLTAATSTYTIAGINAGAKSHALAMSTMKRKRNRQALVSYRGAFTDAKDASGTLAHGRVFCPFQDVKARDSAGSVVQARPWMAAVKAAGMQAAGGYRSIVRKNINISGALQAAGDFNPNTDSQVEDALQSGLCPIRRDPTGAYYWVSDQTTYGKDNNWIWNSLQAVYASDVVALTLAEQMEAAAVGQSVSDFGAADARTAFGYIMSNLRRLKWIAPSSDAPAGYRNESFKLVGPVLSVSCEVKVAGCIYFVPINFSITQITQSA